MAKHPGKCPRCGHRVDFDTAVGDHLVCSQCQASLSVPKRGGQESDPLLGKTLGQFRIVELLGHGGMGAVYKARQPALDRFVAIKVLPQELSADATFVQRFNREARAAAAVAHPNIIDVYDVGEDRGYHYIAMELVRGDNLDRVLARDGCLAPGRALELMKQTAAALAAAHAAGVLHRDVKPANILLTGRGTAKVADFGLAKRSEVDVSVTQSGQALGTPLYISPEAARGKPLDPRSDLYSLGAAFYHLLAGRPPFQGATPAEVLVKHVEAQPPPLGQLAPNVPTPLRHVVHRLLRKNPAGRYQSAEDLLAALQRAGARMDVAPAAPTQTMPPAVRPTLDERREERRKRNRQATGLAVATGLVILAVGVVLALTLLRRVHRARPAAKRPEPRLPATDAAPRVVPPRRPAPATAAPPATRTPAPPAKPDTERLERTAAILFHNAQILADRFDWPAAGNYLKRLDAECSHSEFYAANRTAIQALAAKVDDELHPKTPAELGPKPSTTAPPAPGPTAAERAAQQRRQLEARYAKALAPAEALVRAWDFAGAAAALAAVELAQGELAARLAARRDDVARLAALKAKMIERIKTGQPRLSTRSLVIPGTGADLVDADEKGITARPPGGQGQLHAWHSLSDRSVRELVHRTIDRQSAGDSVAAGILWLALGDLSAAEKHLEKARTLGANVGRHLGPIAAAAFARAKGLLASKQFAQAHAALAGIGQRYADTPWLRAHKDGFEAARSQAAAETLYARAAALFAERRLFELKPVVDTLKADHPTSAPVTDKERRPSFPLLAKAVGQLGKILRVQKGGQGDFETIQEAILAAPPNSLIEIGDSRAYGEALAVPKGKDGLTLRGKEGCWPTLTADGKRCLVDILAPAVTLERLVLVHRPGKLTGHCSCVSERLGGGLRLRSVLAYVAQGANRHAVASALSAPITVDTCILFGGPRLRGPLVVRDSIWTSSGTDSLAGPVDVGNSMLSALPAAGACTVRHATIPGLVTLKGAPNTLADSILGRIDSVVADTRIDHCNVYGKEPYSALAKPGARCFSKDPQFRDPARLDFRLKKASPCRGRASDGRSDLGCRYTSGMRELLNVAHALRKKGLIKF